MKHPITDCKIQISEGIEAHLEQIEYDILNLKIGLSIAMLKGVKKYNPIELVELTVDLEILEEYVEKII